MHKWPGMSIFPGAVQNWLGGVYETRGDSFAITNRDKIIRLIMIKVFQFHIASAPDPA
ncbi:hypothetical protein D3C77_153860 [compost metagenome]